MSPSDSAQQVRILVADDEKALRDVLVLHLSNMGYEVIEAVNGQEALDKAFAERPALVILDVTMPLVNGWDVARQLRRAPELADMKIMILSGIGEDVLETSLPVFGADMALDKPFELEELEEALRRLLN